MTAILDALENQAMRLSPHERGKLIHRLIVSLEGEPEESPELVANAWDEEIGRRSAEIDSGTATLTPAEDVFAKIDEKLRKASA